MSSNGPKEISSTQIVLEAARDLHALNQRVTRTALVKATGLSQHVVDERLRILTTRDELLIRMGRGEYQPAKVFHETRAMSRTILPNGLVKYECGDDVLELSPTEDRVLADLSAGALVKLVGIERNRQVDEAYGSLGSRVEHIEKIQRDRDRRRTPRVKPKEKTEA